jgi:hypothetical protein
MEPWLSHERFLSNLFQFIYHPPTERYIETTERVVNYPPPPQQLTRCEAWTNCGHKMEPRSCRDRKVVLHRRGCEPKGARKMLNVACKSFMVRTNMLRMRSRMNQLKSVGWSPQNCHIKKSQVRCVSCPNTLCVAQKRHPLASRIKQIVTTLCLVPKPFRPVYLIPVTVNPH